MSRTIDEIYEELFDEYNELIDDKLDGKHISSFELAKFNAHYILNKLSKLQCQIEQIKEKI